MALKGFARANKAVPRRQQQGANVVIDIPAKTKVLFMHQYYMPVANFSRWMTVCSNCGLCVRVGS